MRQSDTFPLAGSMLTDAPIIDIMCLAKTEEGHAKLRVSPALA